MIPLCDNLGDTKPQQHTRISDWDGERRGEALGIGSDNETVLCSDSVRVI